MAFISFFGDNKTEIEKKIQYLKTVKLKIPRGIKSKLVVLCKVVINAFSSLLVIFCSFISHLIGCETINIPEIFSDIHSFTGKTVMAKKNFFQSLSYSTSLIKNVHHTLTPCTLSSYILDCSETETVKVQSSSKRSVPS